MRRYPPTFAETERAILKTAKRIIDRHTVGWRRRAENDNYWDEGPRYA